jgi:hypothetical protein
MYYNRRLLFAYGFRPWLRYLVGLTHRRSRLLQRARKARLGRLFHAWKRYDSYADIVRRYQIYTLGARVFEGWKEVINEAPSLHVAFDNDQVSDLINDPNANLPKSKIRSRRSKVRAGNSRTRTNKL